MTILKLSPSKIENYRKYLFEEYAGTITKEKVIASIKGEQEWSQEATFGSAAHAVMQFGAERYFDPESKKYSIQDEQMPNPVILSWNEVEKFDTFHKEHPYMVWESRATLTIEVDGYQVNIYMRIDGMEGLTIHENKTGKYDMDYDFFEASYQWRCYLLATGAYKVQYNVFAYDEPNTKRAEYEVNYDYMTLFPYPTMLNDLKEGIRGVIEFCRIHDLMNYITINDNAKEKGKDTT